MTTTQASDNRLAIRIAKDAIKNHTLRPADAPQLEEIRAALAEAHPPKMTDVTPRRDRGVDFKELKVGNDVFVQKTDVTPGAAPSYFYADSISHPMAPIGRPSKKAAVIESWRAVWKPYNQDASTLYDFDVPQAPDSAAPKGSDAARWMKTDRKENSKNNPDYWIGIYKNEQGNLLVRDDNYDVRIFDKSGRYVAKANMDQMNGFMKGWPT
jgi:hypothetical protein